MSVVFGVAGFSGEDVNVAISTGLVARAAFSVLGCDGLDCVALCAGAPDADEAMASTPGGSSSSKVTGGIHTGGGGWGGVRLSIGKMLCGKSGSIK